MQKDDEPINGSVGGAGENEEELSPEEFYNDAVITCFRFFNFTSIEEVNRLTMREYDLLIQAAKLKQVDKDYRNHLQAFLNFAATAKKKAGNGKERPVYSRFKNFYNYDAALKKAKGGVPKGNSRFSALSKFIRDRDKENE